MKIHKSFKIFCTVCLIKQYYCLNFIDLPLQNSQYSSIVNNAGKVAETRNYLVSTSTETNFIRKHFLKEQNSDKMLRASSYTDENDENIKYKISTLVQQTIHDTEMQVNSIEHIKENHRKEAPYKAGFIMSMIKKSRDVLDELFNFAVKHKDEWKSLEQLKIFELIVHNNVDISNLVKQLVEINAQYLNSTNTKNSSKRKRLVY